MHYQLNAALSEKYIPQVTCVHEFVTEIDIESGLDALYVCPNIVPVVSSIAANAYWHFLEVDDRIPWWTIMLPAFTRKPEFVPIDV